MFSFGFYNSKNNDRMYNAEHFGKLFDGIIQDGVFGAAQEPLNTMFNVQPKDIPNLQVTLNPGKAWLMHTWNILDSKATITFNQVAANYKRTDAIVLEVNNNYTELQGSDPRTNSIKIVESTNTPVSYPDSLPQLTQIWNSNHTDKRIWQYPIAYITIYGSDYDGGSTETQFTANQIKSSNISNRVNFANGTDSDKYLTWIPLVTGAMMDADIGNYLPISNWQALFDQMIATDTARFNQWFDDLHALEVEDPTVQSTITQLNLKLDNKFLYGSQIPVSLEPLQVFFQIEEED